MKTRDILNAAAGSVLLLVASGAVAEHEALFGYDEETDTIVYSYHGISDAPPVRATSPAPVPAEADHGDSQDAYDWFLDQ